MSEPADGERVHSKLGASGAERWMNCPGSVALCATIPDPGSTSAARRGSALHLVKERCLVNGLDPSIYVGQTIAEFDYKVTESDSEAVAFAVNFARRLIERPGVSWGVEQHFALFDFDAELFGTNDLWVYEPATETLIIGDDKYGHNPVEAVGNPQIRFYGLGALAAFDKPVSKVELYIIQPAAGERDAIKVAHCEPIDLFEFGMELAAAAEETRKPDAPLKSGKWCKYCRAAAVCPRLAADAQAVAGADFADTLEPDDVALLDPAELGLRLAAADVLEGWLKSLRAFARAEAFEGRTPYGFKLVESRAGHRKFKDADLTMRQASRIFNIGEAELFTRAPLSPAAFEKVAKKVADKAAVSEFLKPYLAPPKTGFALVPASDKRPAVTPDSKADADFSDVAEDTTADE